MFDRGEALRKLALNAARLSGLAPLAAPYLSGVGAILMLHRVSRQPQGPLGINRHLAVTPEFLDRLLADLAGRGYDFVTMDEALARIAKPCGRRRFLAITADDAYRDNAVEALPILERHRAPLTIHVSPGLIDGKIDLWWEVLEEIVAASESVILDTGHGPQTLKCTTQAQKIAVASRLHDYLTRQIAEEDRQSVLRDLAGRAGVDPSAPTRRSLMGWDEIRTIAAHPLITIGAHTIHHYNLRRLSEDNALREIAGAADMLRELLGERPRHMAYPYGYRSAVGPREVALAAEAGFASAVTTRHGVLQPQHALYLHALPRISINGRYQQVAHVRTMLSGITTALANAGRRVVTV